MRYFLYLTILFTVVACGRPTNTFFPKHDYDRGYIPPTPNYANTNHWAALPTKTDPTDQIPKKSNLQDEQATAEADVFFVHPTTYTGIKKTEINWNADVNDPSINERTDNTTILHQGSVFNGAGKIYAPRYRQAHINVYYDFKNPAAQQALDTAYIDVKRAFEYYLKHYNNGRPIIIASHSQGTNHAEHLLLDFFDGKPLQNQLVAAYLVGMPIPVDTFKNIPPCKTPEQIGCFCSWSTYQKGYYPPKHKIKLHRSLAVNPLIWTTDETYAGYDKNEGGVGRTYKIKKNVSDAQVHQGMVWIRNPKITGVGLLKIKNWHVADYNLFYLNVRNNAKLRVEEYLKYKKKK